MLKTHVYSIPSLLFFVILVAILGLETNLNNTSE
jgi:ABC-type dipeptide/oligopeptide/nickel transport system permease subunit